MIVVNPDDESHNLNVLPRYYGDELANDLKQDNITVQITREDTRQDLAVTVISQNLSDGFLIIKLTTTFRDNCTYRLKIYNTTTDLVYFRGKIYSTTQASQNYLIHG